jgi:hypothetical protein
VVYKVTEVVYKVTKVVYKVTEVVYKVTEVVYKVTKVVYKVTEVVYKVTEVVYKVTKVVYRVTEVVYKVTEAVYKVNEVVYKFFFFYEEQFYFTFHIDVALTLFPSLLIESIFLHPYSSDPFYYHPPVYSEFTQTLSFPHFFLQFCIYFLYLPYLLHAAPVSPSSILSPQQFTLHVTKYIILSLEHRSR